MGAKGSAFVYKTGSAYLYDFSDPNNIIETKLTASDAAEFDAFGSVALSGATALVGASWDGGLGGGFGSAYLFDVATGSQIAKLTASDAAAFDHFGSVAISGSTALVGAYGNDDAGSDSGSAYLFDLAALSVGIGTDEFWMYQSLPGQGNSDLTAGVSVTDDPMGNSSYSYEWEIVLAGDVTLAPVTVDGGGAGDAYWTFAARGCDEPGGLSDSGQTFTVRVTITGDDYGNTGQAEAEFGIALLGDVNNDGIINVADRSIANAFWRLGSVGAYTLRDCDVNSDGIVNVADRSIANAVWRGILGQNSVSSPCPLR